MLHRREFKKGEPMEKGLGRENFSRTNKNNVEVRLQISLTESLLKSRTILYFIFNLAKCKKKVKFRGV
jgi:hypothetical protein